MSAVSAGGPGQAAAAAVGVGSARFKSCPVSQTALKCRQNTQYACAPQVLLDGLLGPETCGAAKQADQKALMAALRSEAAGECRLRVARSADQIVFQGGWLNRAYA